MGSLVWFSTYVCMRGSLACKETRVPSVNPRVDHETLLHIISDYEDEIQGVEVRSKCTTRTPDQICLKFVILLHDMIILFFFPFQNITVLHVKLD